MFYLLYQPSVIIKQGMSIRYNAEKVMAYNHFIYDIICIRSNERQTFFKSKKSKI